MENDMTNLEMETKLSITSDASIYLKTTANWANFMAIIGFIGTGLMVLAAIFMMVISPMSALNATFGFPVSLIGLLYLVLAVLYFFPAYFLFNFAQKTKLAMQTNIQETLDESFKNLKNMFKFLGIMTIVIISLYLIAIPTMFIFGLSKGFVH